MVHPFSATTQPVDPDALVVIAAAIADHERLRFRYHDTGRHVEPQATVTAGQRWYLLAFDLDRQDWRTFRLDRLTKPTATGARAATREVPGGDVAAFVAEQTVRMAPAYPADIVIHAQAAQVLDRLGGPPPGTLPDRPDGRCRWLAPPDTVEGHALRLAAIGLPFEVGGPAELTAHLRSTAALFQAATADADTEPTNEWGRGRRRSAAARVPTKPTVRRSAR